MKRITLLLCLLMASLGFSQTVLEDFEGTAPTLGFSNGPGSVAIVPDPAPGGTNGNVLEIITAAMSAPWQQGELYFQGDWMDLTTDKTVDVDVYSLTAFDMLARVEGGTGPVAATDASHGGTGWETLTFDFNIPKDVPGIANGSYPSIFFFNLWDSSANGGNGGWITANNESIVVTSYVDNITATAIMAPETCDDGILNNEEEEIDCGGPNCAACPTVPTEAAPTPPPSNAAGVRSIFSDAYTDIANVNWNPGFGPSNVAVIDVVANSDNIKQANFPGFIAADFAANRFDATEMTMFHCDFWSNDADLNGKVFNLKIVNFGSDPSNNAELNALQYDVNAGTTPPIASGEWVSIDVPLSAFLGVPQAGQPANARDGIAQFLVTSNMGTTYIDNVYLYNPNLSTEDFNLSNISVVPNPTKSVWNVKLNNQNITAISVFDILGKQVITLAPNSSEASIDAAALKDGIYLAKITSESGTRTIKLVKN